MRNSVNQFHDSELLCLIGIPNCQVDKLSLVWLTEAPAQDCLIVTWVDEGVRVARLVRGEQLEPDQRVQVIRRADPLPLFQRWHRHQKYSVLSQGILLLAVCQNSLKAYQVECFGRCVDLQSRRDRWLLTKRYQCVCVGVAATGPSSQQGLS